VRVLPIPATWTELQGTDINNSGQVVGWGFDGTTHRPFLASAASFEPMPLPPGFTSGHALAINNSGQIVGWGLGQVTPNPQAFIGSSSGITAVPLSGAFYSSPAYDINDSGQIVGSGFLPNQMFNQPFIGTSSGMTPVPSSPGWAGDAEAYSINNLGQIIGIGYYLGNFQFFFGDIHGIAAPVPIPPGWSPDTGLYFGQRAMQINDAGQIVGELRDSNGDGRVFFSTLTSTTLLPVLSPCLYAVNPSLNNAGQVVGDSCTGFIWDAQNGMRFLHSLVPAGWEIYTADAINDKGQILAAASNASNGFSGLAILDPIVDTTPPSSKVLPLPAIESSASFLVQWSGSDTQSGILDFTIYVSDNAGPFVPWLTHTAATQATFTGITGHKYAFYSLARDVAGNVEGPKSAGEASTVIPAMSLSLWANQVMGLGQSVRLPVSLSAPAPASGVNVTLVTSDPSRMTVTASVFIPAGRTSPNIQPTLTGLGLGTVSITASTPSYLSDTKPQRVTGMLGFIRCCVTLPATSTLNAVLTISGPAPASGLTINLSSDNPSVATVPATVSIPAKATSVNVPITGVVAGQTVVHASALPNLAEVSIRVTVQR
jgi:uncharacterized membrane protein